MPERPPALASSKGPSLDPLMAQHDGLVHAVLRRQWGGTLSYAERLQAGRLGLWQALQHYDPTRDTAFHLASGSMPEVHLRLARHRPPHLACRPPRRTPSRPASTLGRSALRP